MSAIRLALSGLRKGVDLVSPLMPHIVGAFRPFGVDIVPEAHRILDQDPQFVTDGWLKLVADLEQESGMREPAHLVVTNIPPEDPNINGMLLDPQCRGVAAIFLSAYIFQTDGGPEPDVICQVCIHEIGHLLSLTHTDCKNDSYASAMSPAASRQVQTTQQAWAMAMADMKMRSEEVLSPPDGPSYYPFGAQTRACLRAAGSDPLWLPFAGPFRGLNEGWGATQDRACPCKVSPGGVCQ
jgi:hypothetical protein